MTPAQQSLVALIGLRNSIERVILCFYSVNTSGTNLEARSERFPDANLCFAMQSYLQILLSSFLEEWPRFASRAKNDPDVRKTLQLVQPAMERFEGWRDLPSVRSKVLAHPFRDKQGQIVLAWDVLRDSKAPTTFAETLLLGFCALMAVDRVKVRHAKEVAETDSYLLQLDRTVPEKGILTATELEAEFARLQAAFAATHE
jgi:hypothetical protein